MFNNYGYGLISWLYLLKPERSNLPLWTRRDEAWRIQSSWCRRPHLILLCRREGRVILCFRPTWRETWGCCVSGWAILQRKCWMKHEPAVSNTKASGFRANQSPGLVFSFRLLTTCMFWQTGNLSTVLLSVTCGLMSGSLHMTYNMMLYICEAQVGWL